MYNAGEEASVEIRGLNRTREERYSVHDFEHHPPGWGTEEHDEYAPSTIALNTIAIFAFFDS